MNGATHEDTDGTRADREKATNVGEESIRGDWFSRNRHHRFRTERLDKPGLPHGPMNSLPNVAIRKDTTVITGWRVNARPGSISQTNGGAMTHAQTITNRVIETVARHPGCLLEELVLDCPELTWNQVFLTVDQLTRTGELLLARKGPGVYVVRVATPSPSRQ